MSGQASRVTPRFKTTSAFLAKGDRALLVKAIKGIPAFLKVERTLIISSVSPLLEMVGGWREFLAGGLAEADAENIRRAEKTGRPLGGAHFIAGLEKKLNRSLKKSKPGPRSSRKSN